MLEGWEWLIIGVVAIVIIMWGPSKIPEFARAIGKVKGEYNKASRESENAATATMNKSTLIAAPSSSAAFAQTASANDELLYETARSLGISPVGKTREQLTYEINQRVNALGAA